MPVHAAVFEERADEGLAQGQPGQQRQNRDAVPRHHDGQAGAVRVVRLDLGIRVTTDRSSRG